MVFLSEKHGIIFSFEELHQILCFFCNIFNSAILVSLYDFVCCGLFGLVTSAASNYYELHSNRINMKIGRHELNAS